MTAQRLGIRTCQALGLAVLLAATSALAQEPRGIVVVSDLHMGVGKKPDGTWHRSEDFRWPRALAGFLAHLEATYPQGVDLVVAGDFFELWQHPDPAACAGPGKGAEPVRPANDEEARTAKPADFGCRVDEAVGLMERIARAHEQELGKLAAFAGKNGNCVHVVPGNHDAALVLPEVWEVARKRLSATGGCVGLAGSGLWISHNEKVAVEHGHEIGKDPNAYTNWPHITREFKKADGALDTYIEQPWGQGFVQAIFNREEQEYPLIDNLSPKSAGLWYRSRDKGVGSVKDYAAFVRYNLIGTSLRQLGQLLGDDEEEDAREVEDWADWEIHRAHHMGHRLFAWAMPADDPFREELLSSDEPELVDLRRELDLQAGALPDDEVRALCDRIEIHGGGQSCRDKDAGAALEKLFNTRKRIVGPHVLGLQGRLDPLAAYAYGHTHKFEIGWEAETDLGSTIHVANAGAFQRLIDRKTLKRKSRERDTKPRKLLKSENWETFVDPCYTFVSVGWIGGRPRLTVGAWSMDEENGPGETIDPCSPICPRVGTGCDEKTGD